MQQLNFFDTFYNTTCEDGPTVRAYREVARGQDAAVLKFFVDCAQHIVNRAEPLSPSKVHVGLIQSGAIHSAVPLTSIRRSITNLTKAELLEKTDHKVDGVYGRSEFCWRLAQ